VPDAAGLTSKAQRSALPVRFIEAKPKVVAMDLAGVFDLEYTALKMLTEAERKERSKGVHLEQAVAKHQSSSGQDAGP
jgi:hypothetical protein